MGQQKIVGQFAAAQYGPRTIAGPINVHDQTGEGAGSARSAGSTLITSVPVQTQLAQKLAIQGFQISCEIGLMMLTNIVPLAQYGKLGKLIGGICSQKSISSNAMVPLPADQFTNLTVLYDGEVDPAPPTTRIQTNTVLITSSSQPCDPITVATNLSQPVVVTQGDQLSIGLWLTPSIVSNTGMYVRNATYILYADDGQKDQQGWGAG